jgi:hypothetical protein
MTAAGTRDKGLRKRMLAQRCALVSNTDEGGAVSSDRLVTSYTLTRSLQTSDPELYDPFTEALTLSTTGPPRAMSNLLRPCNVPRTAYQLPFHYFQENPVIMSHVLRALSRNMPETKLIINTKRFRFASVAFQELLTSTQTLQKLQMTFGDEEFDEVQTAAITFGFRIEQLARVQPRTLK